MKKNSLSMKKILLLPVIILWVSFTEAQSSFKSPREIRTASDFQDFLGNNFLKINSHADGARSIFYVELCQGRYAISIDHETGEVYIAKDGSPDTSQSLDRISRRIKDLHDQGKLTKVQKNKFIVYTEACPS